MNRRTFLRLTSAAPVVAAMRPLAPVEIMHAGVALGDKVELRVSKCSLQSAGVGANRTSPEPKEGQLVRAYIAGGERHE